MSFAKEMSFYTAYHQEKRNILVHIFGVPMIIFSLFALLSLVTIYSHNGYPFTLAMLFFVCVMAYYFMLDFVFALTAAVFYGLILLGSHYIALMGTPYAIGAFIVGQLLGWVSQILAHAKFENNRPALLDNLTQALFSAPIFVIADVFFELGFRKDLEKEIKDILRAEGRLREETAPAAS